METTSSRELYFEDVRSRARRLRLPADDVLQSDRGESSSRGHRFNRFRFGMLAALIIDVIAVAVLASSPDISPAFVLLLGPLSVLFAYPELATITLVVFVVSGVAGRWRFAFGLLLFQVGWALLGVGWLSLFGSAGGIFPF